MRCSYKAAISYVHLEHRQYKARRRAVHVSRDRHHPPLSSYLTCFCIAHMENLRSQGISTNNPKMGSPASSKYQGITAMPYEMGKGYKTWEKTPAPQHNTFHSCRKCSRRLRGICGVKNPQANFDKKRALWASSYKDNDNETARRHCSLVPPNLSRQRRRRFV